MADEVGWCIERHLKSRLHYWAGRNGDDWRPDHSEALRFARRADAELMLTYHCQGVGRVAEHMWHDMSDPGRPVPPHGSGPVSYEGPRPSRLSDPHPAISYRPKEHGNTTEHHALNDAIWTRDAWKWLRATSKSRRPLKKQAAAVAGEDVPAAQPPVDREGAKDGR